MMRRQLDDVRAGGEPLAVLTASEPAIYGRFGYGTATYELSVSVDTARVRLSVPPGTDEVRLRLVDPLKALPDCEQVYAALVARRPGMPARQPGWERVVVLDPESGRGGASPLKCVVAERADGEVAGYARYRVRADWEAHGPEGKVEVADLDALDPAATAALWRYLFEIDLTSTVRARKRPADDPLLHLVSDVRRAQPSLRDSLHLRLVDLPAALEARTYGAPWTWCWTSRTRSARGTRGAGGSSPVRTARWAAPGPRTRRTWSCRYGSWARRTSAGSPWPPWRRPAGCASCARAP